MLACYNNRMNIVKLLLSVSNINVDIVSEFGMTALMCAVYRNNDDIVKLLLKFGASANSVATSSRSGPNALMLACHMGKVHLVDLLLESGAECNGQCPLNGWTPLMYAVNSASSTPALLRTLLDHGADANVKSWSCQTALDIAQALGRANFTDLLVLMNTEAQSLSTPIRSRTQGKS
jgi:ankyrin repeat protein